VAKHCEAGRPAASVRPGGFGQGRGRPGNRKAGASSEHRRDMDRSPDGGRRWRVPRTGGILAVALGTIVSLRLPLLHAPRFGCRHAWEMPFRAPEWLWVDFVIEGYTARRWRCPLPGLAPPPPDMPPWLPASLVPSPSPSFS
jgi:hypothetical protein